MVSDMLFFEKSFNEIKKKGSRKIQLEIRQKLHTITLWMNRRFSFAETWQIVNTSDGPSNYGFIESMSEDVPISQCSTDVIVFKTVFSGHQNSLILKDVLFKNFNNNKSYGQCLRKSIWDPKHSKLKNDHSRTTSQVI